MKQSTPKDIGKPNQLASFPIVGIGASAGGLEAFTQLLSALPLNTGMSFVLVQHLDPDHKSSLVRLLTKATELPVQEIENGVELKPNNVYVITASKEVTIKHAALILHNRTQAKQPSASIDRFLISLAKDQRQNAIGVVLSGVAHDGTLGLTAIKEMGGFTFAQDKTAPSRGMPEAAIQAGVVDFILPPEGIAKALLQIAKHLPVEANAPGHALDFDAGTGQLAEILGLLRQYTGTDLHQYKTSTLTRRITRRLMANKLKDLTQYIAYIKANHKEAEILRQDMLINVTSFFRDPLALRELEHTILPALVKDRTIGAPLRFWVAGCATGEEVYSLAMIVQEFLKSHHLDHMLQIFGTDLSAAAIDIARSGQYSKTAMKCVSEQRKKQFFVKKGEDYQVKQYIRDMCVFAPHNLATDPPFSKLDIVSCCNVLIYLQSELQRRLLNTFHYALKPGGYLILGTSETVGLSRALFAPLGKGVKAYVRKTGVVVLPTVTNASRESRVVGATIKTMAGKYNNGDDITKTSDSLLLSRYVPASVVIDDDMEIVQFRGETGPYLQPASGKATLNLLRMARPGLSLGLRSAVKEVQKSRKSFQKSGLIVNDGKTMREVSVEITPLSVGSNRYLLIVFSDSASTILTKQQAPKLRLRAGGAKNSRIASLEETLELSQEEMKRLIEENDLLNEEVQSSNEERSSSNEELQTLNEELETSSEELQSTNDELTITNQTIRETNKKLVSALNYTDAILKTIREPLIVLNTDLYVVKVNDNFCKTFAVSKKQSEGRLIYELGNNQWDIPALRSLLSQTITEHTSFNDFEVTHEFNDIGRKVMLLNARQIEDRQLILLVIEDITERQDTARALRASAESFRFMAEALPQKVFTAEPNGKIDYFNPEWSEYTGASFDDPEDLGWVQFIHHDDVDEIAKQWRHSIESGEPFYAEYRFRRADGVYHWHLTQAQAMRDSNNKIIKWMGSSTDIDSLKRNDDIKARLELLTKQRNELLQLNKLKDEFTALASHQLRTPATAVKQYISLLMDKYAGEVSTEQMNYLQVAFDSNERQLSIIDELLKSAQLDSNNFRLDKTPQNIVVLAKQVIKQLKPTLDLRQQTAVVESTKKTIMMKIDLAEMMLVLENLVANASKYTYRGKHITIRIQIVEKDQRVEISVIDEGVGIAEEDMTRIFDKFTRVNNELSDTVEGTGLGLYWVKWIVKLHKGSIEVTSTPKKGSTFKISLPL